MERKREIKYTRCFICGNPETLYKKVYKEDGDFIKNPNEFWICDKCFKIKEGELIREVGIEPFYWLKVW